MTTQGRPPVSEVPAAGTPTLSRTLEQTVSITPNPDRLEDLRAEYTETGMVTSDGAVWLFSQVVVLREQVQRLKAEAVVSVVPPATNQAAPVDRAAVLREAAERLAEMRAAEREWLPATGLHKGEQELRRLADEVQAGGPSREATEPQPETQTAPTAADVQHMLARMRTDAATHDLGHLLGLLARWAASSEGRDVLLDDLIAGGYRLPHACGNCEGIDPDSCLKNPDRAAPAVSSRPGTEQEAWDVPDARPGTTDYTLTHGAAKAQPAADGWRGATEIVPEREVQRLAATGLVGYRQDRGRLLH